MGQLLRHRCDACGFEASVGGGPQQGFRSATWTIHCHDCRDLHDVLVSRAPMKRGWVPEEYACPNNDAHRVELWSASSGCPKCGGAITVADRPDLLWD